MTSIEGPGDEIAETDTASEDVEDTETEDDTGGSTSTSTASTSSSGPSFRDPGGDEVTQEEAQDTIRDDDIRDTIAEGTNNQVNTGSEGGGGDDGGSDFDNGSADDSGGSTSGSGSGTGGRGWKERFTSGIAGRRGQPGVDEEAADQTDPVRRTGNASAPVDSQTGEPADVSTRQRDRLVDRYYDQVDDDRYSREDLVVRQQQGEEAYRVEPRREAVRREMAEEAAAQSDDYDPEDIVFDFDENANLTAQPARDAFERVASEDFLSQLDGDQFGTEDVEFGTNEEGETTVGLSDEALEEAGYQLRSATEDREVGVVSSAGGGRGPRFDEGSRGEFATQQQLEREAVTRLRSEEVGVAATAGAGRGPRFDEVSQGEAAAADAFSRANERQRQFAEGVAASDRDLYEEAARQEAQQEQFGDFRVDVPGTDDSFEEVLGGTVDKITGTAETAGNVVGNVAESVGYREGRGQDDAIEFRDPNFIGVVEDEEEFRSGMFEVGGFQGWAPVERSPVDVDVDQLTSDPSTGKGRFLAGIPEGAGSLAAVPPGLLLTGKEGVEYGGYARQEIESDIESDETERTEQLASDTAAAGGAAAAAFRDYATDNPARFSGQAVGSLVGSGALFKATAQAGRAGTATRYAIQPGEEVASAGLSRAAPGIASKFPNNRIDWEEATVMGGQRAASAARRGASNAADRIDVDVPNVDVSGRVRSAASNRVTDRLAFEASGASYVARARGAEIAGSARDAASDAVPRRVRTGAARAGMRAREARADVRFNVARGREVLGGRLESTNQLLKDYYDRRPPGARTGRRVELEGQEYPSWSPDSGLNPFRSTEIEFDDVEAGRSTFGESAGGDGTSTTGGTFETETVVGQGRQQTVLRQQQFESETAAEAESEFEFESDQEFDGFGRVEPAFAQDSAAAEDDLFEFGQEFQFEFLPETRTEFDQETGLEQEFDMEQEFGFEQDYGQEFELEQEYEFEQESETRMESRYEFEQELELEQELESEAGQEWELKTREDEEEVELFGGLDGLDEDVWSTGVAQSVDDVFDRD